MKHNRQLTIRDALLLTLGVSIGFAGYSFFDPGWYPVGGWPSALLFGRCIVVAVAITLSLLLVCTPVERSLLFQRPGRLVIASTAVSAFSGTVLNWTYLSADIFGGLLESFKFMAFDGILDPSEISPAVFGIVSVLSLGCLSGRFRCAIDWIEVVGFMILLFWGVTSFLHEWLNEADFICGT